MAAEKEQPNSLLRFLTDETDFVIDCAALDAQYYCLSPFCIIVYFGLLISVSNIQRALLQVGLQLALVFRIDWVRSFERQHHPKSERGSLSMGLYYQIG